MQNDKTTGNGYEQRLFKAWVGRCSRRMCPLCHEVNAMNIPEPKLVCKRHRWSSGWICDNCGMRRSDYEAFRQADRPKYYIVNYGKNKSRKFGHLHQAREFAFKYWHDGDEDFKAYNIIRVSNLTRKIVCQQTANQSFKPTPNSGAA